MGDYQNRRHLIKNDQILWNLTQGAIHLSVWSLNCLPLFNFSQVKHLIAEGDLLVQEWSYVIKKGSKIWRMHYLHKCLQLLSMLTPINIAIRIGKDYRYCIDKVLIIRTWQLANQLHIFSPWSSSGRRWVCWATRKRMHCWWNQHVQVLIFKVDLR